ncbi:tetratricopeptide repeat protein [Streptomyces sp. NPDC093093]|uniref:tetratricopeptide repeat protein n=1 Tax=Streptomyces sp. NPDC093093 TaxID=3366025 RepID=UPI00380FC452
MRTIGRTAPLRPDQARQVAERLTAALPGHPWTSARSRHQHPGRPPARPGSRPHARPRRPPPHPPPRRPGPHPRHHPTGHRPARHLGEDHPGTLASRNNLAYAYQSVGDLGRAIPLYEQALTDTLRVLGESHPLTGTVRNNLAVAVAERDGGEAHQL